jgi:hypothetical protein
MTAMFPLFLFFVWFLAVLVPTLGKKSRGEPSGVSIFPGFPLCPLAAWGISTLLDLAHDRLGYYLIGGLHLVLLVCVIVFSVKYLYVIKRKT